MPMSSANDPVGMPPEAITRSSTAQPGSSLGTGTPSESPTQPPAHTQPPSPTRSISNDDTLVTDASDSADDHFNTTFPVGPPIPPHHISVRMHFVAATALAFKDKSYEYT